MAALRAKAPGLPPVRRVGPRRLLVRQGAHGSPGPPPPRDLAAELVDHVQRGWSTITPGLRGVSVAILDRNGKLYTATAA